LVAQHHPPTKRVVRAVSLDHSDVVIWVLLFHQQGEIQTSGAATNAQYVHVYIV
jgi:hypothetical protein